MITINCPSCPNTIVLKATDDRPPPWCPRCGGDLKPHAVPILPADAGKLWNEPSVPSAAVSTSTRNDDTLQVGTSPPLSDHVPPARFSEPNLSDEPLPPSRAVPPAPAWANVFAVACGLIPLVTLGGAIPMAIGCGGASGCIAVARNSQLDMPTRLTLCTAITVGCWLGLFVILGSWMSLFSFS